MESALVVCDSPKAESFFRDFLSGYGFENISVEGTQTKARQRMMSGEFDICVVNSPILGESAEKLACDLALKNVCQIILFVKDEMVDETEAHVEDYGVITLGKPVSRQGFGRALKISEISQRRIALAQREIIKLQKKVDEAKLVGRAKCLLIENRQFTEAEAHHYIEKQAMDSRSSSAAVAEDIVAFYA